MSKFHVNNKTGRAGQCRATKKGCPLGGDTPHFDTKEEAKAHIEKTEEKKNDKFSKITKNSASGGGSNNGGGVKKTLVGTPDPDNNDGGGEVNNAINRIKENANYFIKNDGGNPKNSGEAEAGEIINGLYEESFRDGVNEDSIKYFKNELSKAAYTASRSYEFSINENGEGDAHDYAKLQVLDSAWDSIDAAMFEEGRNRKNTI